MFSRTFQLQMKRLRLTAMALNIREDKDGSWFRFLGHKDPMAKRQEVLDHLIAKIKAVEADPDFRQAEPYGA